MQSSSGVRALLAGLSVNLVLFGASTTLFAAAIPSIVRQHSWTYTEAGVVMAASAIGYVAATLICGLLLHRRRPKGILVGALLLQSASFFFFARFPSVALNTALNLAIGLGQGANEVVSNYTAIRAERDGGSRVMNFLHAAFCLGAIVGPLGMAGMLQSRYGWRAVFPAAGALLLLVAAGFGSISFDAVGGERDRRTGGPRVAAGRPALLGLYALTLLLYVGVELSMSSWSPELLVRELGASAGAGASAVAFLWAGLLVGRLGISWLYRGSRQHVPVLILALASVLFVALLLLARSPLVALAILLSLGLGFSGIYPLIMTIVGKTFPSPSAIGFAATAGGVGSFVFPFALAGIADRWGLRFGFVLCLAASAALVVCAGLMAAAAGRSGDSTACSV